MSEGRTEVSRIIQLMLTMATCVIALLSVFGTDRAFILFMAFSAGFQVALYWAGSEDENGGSDAK